MGEPATMVEQLQAAWRRWTGSRRTEAPAPPPPPRNSRRWEEAFEQRLPELDGEVDRIRVRRAALGPALIDSEQPVVGLALSGGGIRSATFSLGLLREFGKLGLLHRFDYLSTVSGGSYIGSYYCGLFAHRGGTPVVKPEDFPDPFESSPDAARRKLGSASLEWLRQSGRYLAPQGAGDYWYALGLLVRNWLGVHIVIGSVIMTLALFAVGFRMLLYGEIWPRMAFAPGGVLTFAPLILLLAVPVIIHVWCGWAYWLTRRGNTTSQDSRVTMAQFGSVIIVVSTFAAGYLNLPSDPQASLASGLTGAGALLIAISVGGLGGLLALWWAKFVVGRTSANRGDQGDAPTEELLWDERRSALTRPLACCAMWFVGILVAALADGFGYWLFATQGKGLVALVGTPVVAAAIVPAARWLLPRLIQLAGSAPGADKGGKGRSRWFSAEALYQFGAAVGAIVLIGAVAIFWIVLAYKAAWPQIVQAPPAVLSTRAVPAPPVAADRGRAAAAAAAAAAAQTSASDGFASRCPGEFTASSRAMSRCEVAHAGPALLFHVLLVWLGWLAGLLFLSLCIGFTPTFINLSGLTSFYAGRLRRAYLGAGNLNRIAPRDLARRNPAVDVWDASDDIKIADYFPCEAERATAAPLHLINITLNETRGEGSNVVQRDRHGRNLVVSPVGIYYEADEHAGGDGGGRKELKTIKYDAEEHERLPLSTWIAISGAAFSTGLGARTGFPLTQLATLANVRLGYWWRASRSGRPFASRYRIWRNARRKGLRRKLFERYPTQYDLFREFRGDFPGISESYWYLSDGGHFENTGAYELLRRRLPLIVVSDNGQDMRFEYEDLANLVRKARIDFGCEIEFLGLEELDAQLGHDRALRAAFGTLAQISGDSPAAARAVAAIASVDYPDGTRGTLILIKPRLTGDGPADLIRYKASNSAFPQQPTTDQFFDEAQWESYYHLGRLICRAVFSPSAAPSSGWRPFYLRGLFEAR